MNRAIMMVAMTLASVSYGQDEMDGGVDTLAPVAAAETLTACRTANADAFFGDSEKRDDYGMPTGPAAIGYFEADVATGRRACPRTEFGLGARFAAIIDTPNFYGNLGVSGVLFGSYALNERTELFATLEAVSFTYAVNASLSKTGLTLGNLTAGATRVLYTPGNFVGSASVRLLLPTSFEIPGARLIGVELSHLTAWEVRSWLELHSAVGVDFSAAISGAQAFPRLGATALIGGALQPTSWFAFVLDVSGHLGVRSFLAPTAALRFRVASLGIELGATLPLVGTDRHDFIIGGRFSWRL